MCTKSQLIGVVDLTMAQLFRRQRTSYGLIRRRRWWRKKKRKKKTRNSILHTVPGKMRRECALCTRAYMSHPAQLFDYLHCSQPAGQKLHCKKENYMAYAFMSISCKRSEHIQRYNFTDMKRKKNANKKQQRQQHQQQHTKRNREKIFPFRMGFVWIVSHQYRFSSARAV